MYNNLNTNHLYRLLTLVVCTLSLPFVYSQTNWSDSFLDSNFNQNPIWFGDTLSFIVNANKELQLNAPAVSNKKIIQTPSQAIWEASWEFSVKFDFNPSTNNYSRVYFASQAGFQNGYYVQLGGNSQDRILLRTIENGLSTTLIQSTDDWLDLSSVDVKIKVERNQQGVFNLSADTSGAYSTIGTAIDSTFYTSSVFGWECIYTSTRSDKFYIDDIYVSGQVYQDTVQPTITKATFLDSNSIELTFSEPIDSGSILNLSSFVLAPNGINPSSVSSSGFKAITLQFPSNFANRTQLSLWVENITDLFGNPIKDTTLNLFYFKPSWGDVTLSEIMFDPTPSVQLPDYEYLELYNNSIYDINLEGWILTIGSKSITLPPFLFLPNSYLLITDSSAITSFNSISVLGIDWPSGLLPNSGALISLLDPDSNLIYSAEYSTSLFSNTNKVDGGWSLENKSITASCVSPLLWDGSENLKGGTPGLSNSISSNGMQSVPNMKYLIYKSPRNIEIVFSESLDSFNLESSFPIQSAIRKSLSSVSVDVFFTNTMQANMFYEITSTFRSGCFGEGTSLQTLRFGIPKMAEASEVLINEILFNPSADNYDFVEIYNSSEHCVTLNTLRFSQVNEFDGLPYNVETITNDSVLFPPGEFWVFTRERNTLIENYQLESNAFVFESSLPTMSDNEGTIGVCSASLEWIDKLSYSNKWHHELISVEEDVSLERVNLNSQTQQSSNWHSATYSSGYASPTEVNSQAGKFSSAGSVTLSTELVTPNNDGVDDFLSITFSLDKSGWVGSILVFDAFGRGVLPLLNNKPIGVNEVVLWHGLGKGVNRIKRGSYIVFIELWHPDGEKMVVKKGVGVYY